MTGAAVSKTKHPAKVSDKQPPRDRQEGNHVNPPRKRKPKARHSPLVLAEVAEANKKWNESREQRNKERRDAFQAALDQNLTMEQIGEAVGLTKGQVSRIIAGKQGNH